MLSTLVQVLDKYRSMVWLNRRVINLVSYILIASYVGFIIYLVSGLLTKSGLFYRTGIPFGADFLQLWSASAASLKGHAELVYNFPAFKEIETSVVNGNFTGFLPWHYPPSFLLLVLKFSLVPYILSFTVWMVLTLFLTLIVLYKVAPNSLTIKLALAFPATIETIFFGQGTFFIIFLMGSGLLCLEKYPVLAGILLSLIIAYKPQLGFLIVVALLAGRHWKALMAFMSAVAGLALASWLIFGPEVWLAFFKNARAVQQQLYADRELWSKMVTTYASVRLLGGGLALALALQGIVSLGVLVIVWCVWSRINSLYMRASVLALAALLATPHALSYDLSLLLLPMAWAGWEWHKTGWDAGNKSVLALSWFSPVLPTGVLALRFQVAPVVILIFLLFLLYRAGWSVRGGPGDSTSHARAPSE